MNPLRGCLILSVAFLGKIFWENLTGSYWGDPFMAWALVWALELDTRRRLALLIPVGLLEGWGSPVGFLGGLLLAVVVVYLADFLARRFDFSLFYPALLSLSLLMAIFRLGLYGLLPYLMEINGPAGWLGALIRDLGWTLGWGTLGLLGRASLKRV